MITKELIEQFRRADFVLAERAVYAIEDIAEGATPTDAAFHWFGPKEFAQLIACSTHADLRRKYPEAAEQVLLDAHVDVMAWRRAER